MRRKYLLGINDYDEIVFGEPEIRDGIFTMSFDCVIPFCVDDINLVERIEDYLEGLNFESLYKMCVDYYCAPQDLADKCAEWWDIMDVIDCSLYPEEVEVDGETYMFESSSWGQCGFANPKAYTDKGIIIDLMNLWENKHFKKLTEEEMDIFNECIAALEVIDEEKEIKSYIVTLCE